MLNSISFILHVTSETGNYVQNLECWINAYQSFHCGRFQRNLRNTSYTWKWVPLHCNLLLVLQSQVTNAIINSFLNCFRVFTIWLVRSKNHRRQLNKYVSIRNRPTWIKKMCHVLSPKIVYDFRLFFFLNIKWPLSQKWFPLLLGSQQNHQQNSNKWYKQFTCVQYYILWEIWEVHIISLLACE